MSLLDKIFGRMLASKEAIKQKITAAMGVPLLGLDSLASTGYGPEAALAILLPLGVGGLYYFPLVMLGVVCLLIILYLSYRQTIAAYPNGGGAYIVAGENLGKHAGLLAGVALLLDYLLNVTVGISAGVGAVISIFPALQNHTLTICLCILATLAFLNLRGIRQTSYVFITPTIIFILCIAITIVIGLVQSILAGGHPVPINPPTPISEATATVSTWLLLGAFANGLTAMTGVEAITNAVPLFSKPGVPTAQRTLKAIVVILALFLLGLGYLCPVYQISAMDETQPGYQNILSQLIGAVAGHGLFYYIANMSVFIVLTYSAQTSFVDFPRVCRLLADDAYLPKMFSVLGRRLVYSYGIYVLTIGAGLLLIIFKGITFALIPLFAIGAFSAFFFSQAGMVVYWLRKHSSKVKGKLAINTLGAISTAIALFVIITEKFFEGAWIIVIGAPLLAWLLIQVNLYYKKVTLQVSQPSKLQVLKPHQPIVIIPIKTWDKVSEKALQVGLLLSEEIVALHISSENDDEKKQPLKKLWTELVEQPAQEANIPIPQLKIIYSPYRLIYTPILDFITKMKDKHPDCFIAIIIPESIVAHWYEYFLHNVHAKGLRALLFLIDDPKILVIRSPWYLADR